MPQASGGRCSMARHAPMPREGGGWKTPFWGEWGSAATSLQNFNIIACTPSPVAVAVGFFYGAAHFLAGLTKPVPWAPSIGDSPGGTPHGGRKGGRNRQSGKPKAKWRTVFNLPAETQFPLEGGLQMAMFDLGKIALEVGYIIFLADLWRDSLLVGTSAAYRYGGCVPSIVGQSMGDIAQIVANSTIKTLKAVQWGIITDPGHLLGEDTIRVPAGVSLGLTYSVNVGVWDGQPIAPLSFFLYDNSAGAIIGHMGTPPKTGNQGSAYDVGNHGHLPVAAEDRSYSICYFPPDTGYAQLSGHVYAWDALTVNNGLLFDP